MARPPSHPKPGKGSRKGGKRAAPVDRLGLRAFARARGVHLRAVQEAIERGVLAQSVVVVAGRRMIEAELGAKEWAENADPTRRAQGEGMRRKKSAPDPVLEEAAELSAALLDLTMAEAARLRMIYESEVKRLAVAKLEGELVDSSEVERRAFEVAREVRQGMLAIPDRISGVLATVEDPAEIARRLQVEIVETLTRLADDLVGTEGAGADPRR